MRSFSVFPVAGLLLKKPFANYLPTSREPISVLFAASPQ
jgi:hypothetical protein